MEDCCRALQVWDTRDRPGTDWTFHHYIELVSTYRQKVENGKPAILMVVLPRCNSGEIHSYWIADISPTMRHTCSSSQGAMSDSYSDPQQQGRQTEGGRGEGRGGSAAAEVETAKAADSASG